jgi:hypothetical protein
MKSMSFSSFVIQLASLASAAIPLTLSLLTATSEPYWLDSPEFTAAVKTLGIPHPPGHPLYVMLTAPFTLLPFGTIGLRVSIASAVYGAVASYLLFKSTRLVLNRTTDAVPEWLNAIIALGGSVLASTSYAWWFQSVRQEVYSMQILLVTGALYPVLQFCFTPRRDASHGRFLVLSSFLFGLGLTNHHFIMMVSLPAAIPAFVALAKTGLRNPVVQYAKMLGAAVAGLLPYLFIYLRSRADLSIALGGAHTLKEFFWVVSAQVYQKSMNQENAVYLQDQAREAIFTLMGEMGPIIVVVSLAGAYLLLRRRSTRLAGITLLLLQLVTLFMRALMGIDPFNPDYYGYILGSIAVTALFAAVTISISAHVLFRTVNRTPWVAATIALLAFLVPVYQARAAYPKANLRDFTATRIIFDAAISDVPTGTVVITSYYKLFFVLHSARLIDGSRADVRVVNPQLFGYPGYLAAVTRDLPELKTLAWSIFVRGEITEKAISDLALAFPLRVEPSPWSEPLAMKHLFPTGLLYTALPEPTSTADVKQMSASHAKRWKSLYRLLGNQWEEHETWRFLSWCHYLDAIYFARMGARDAARQSIDFSRAIGSSTWQLNQLEDALKEGKGPVDVTPFQILPQSDDSDADDPLRKFQ